MAIETYADLLKSKFTLAYHCWRCQRWTDADLPAIVAAGRGSEVFIGRRVRCSQCGELGTMQVRPPNKTSGSGSPEADTPELGSLTRP